MNTSTLLAAAISLCLSAACFAQEFSSDPDYTAFHLANKGDGEDTVSIWWTTTQFGNRQRTWEELLRFHQQHARLYPQSEHRNHVMRRIQILERMIGEKKPPESQRTERLIYELREVRVSQFMQPNTGLRVLRQPIPKELTEDEQDLPAEVKSAIEAQRTRIMQARNAAQLLYEEVGVDCINSLIDHIDDDTLTRSVDYWRSFVYSHSVLTVGQCCREILDELVPPARVFDLSTDPQGTKSAMKLYYAQRVAESQEAGKTKP